MVATFLKTQFHEATRLCERTHSTTRNDFPVGLTPKPPMFLSGFMKTQLRFSNFVWLRANAPFLYWILHELLWNQAFSRLRKFVFHISARPSQKLKRECGWPPHSQSPQESSTWKCEDPKFRSAVTLSDLDFPVLRIAKVALVSYDGPWSFPVLRIFWILPILLFFPKCFHLKRGQEIDPLSKCFRKVMNFNLIQAAIVL